MSAPEVIDAAAEVLGARARRDEPLAPLSTYRAGGAAALFLEAADLCELRLVARAVAETGIDVLVVGNGSNLLVADRGFPGLAIRLGAGFSHVDVDVGSGTVRAGGAALLPVVARRSVQAGLAGFEWAVGVPGSVGGAVRMNAGGHGSEMSQTLVGVHVVDLRTGEDGAVPVDRLDLRYRRSAVGAHSVVTEATLALEAGDHEKGRALLSEIVRWRRENQPGGQNAGSVFTNPPGDSAGRLVDAAGCRGRRRGTAEVSTKHANFIQAGSAGSADDVFALMVEVRDAVEAHSGVRLHPETVLVGFDTGPFA